MSITGAQIRAARGVLNWSVQELSEESGVATATIKRYELETGIPKSRKSHLTTLQRVFEDAGIEFVGAPDDAPGIRIHARPSAGD